MNIVKLFREFGQMNEREPIHPDAQVLYYNMVQIFNLKRWPKQLVVSTQELCNKTSLSRKRVTAARQLLLDLDVIEYRQAKRASGSPSYALVFLYETHNEKDRKRVFHNDTQQGTHSESDKEYVFHNDTHGVSIGNTQSEDTPDSKGTQEPPKHNKLHNTTTKDKQENISVPNGTEEGQGSSDKEQPKKEKKVPRKKRKKKEDSTPHWMVLVDVWFEFYEKHEGLKPSFAGSDPRELKEIVGKLQKRAEEEEYEWTEEVAKDTLLYFLKIAKRGKWLKDHFLLMNINRQFDTILSHAIREKTGSSEGESVEDAFRKLDDLPD